MKIDEKILIENQKKTFINQEKYCFNEYVLAAYEPKFNFAKVCKISLSLSQISGYIGYMKVGFIYIFWFTLSSTSSII